jgi:hypothetical protein
MFSKFAYSWSDANANGLVDFAEIKLASRGVRYNDGCNCFLTHNGDVITSLGMGGGICIVPNEGSESAPKWNWDHSQPLPCIYGTRERTAINALPSSVYRDTESNIYAAVNNQQGTNDLCDVPPSRWPNSKYHSSRFIKWDAAGKEIFSVGTHTDCRPNQPGEFSDVRALLAETKDCLVLMDAITPASVWTKDGLYAGMFNDDDPKDPIGFFDNQWGQVVTTTAGEVLWGPMASVNSTPFYKITGWDGWSRQRGTFRLDAESIPAKRQGTGLACECFATSDFSGPSTQRIDPAIWFGSARGDHRQLPQLNPPLRAGSYRWSGFVEPPLTESFTFRIFTYGNATSGSKIRVWIAGKLAIESWNGIASNGPVTGWNFTRDLRSPRIPMRAGHPVSIKIEYVSRGGPDAHLHLYWTSASLDLRHVPRSSLYAEAITTHSQDAKSNTF